MNPFTEESIQRQLLASFPDSQVTVHDMTGGGDHFDVLVVSAQFSGKNPVQRHRLVYDALGSAVGFEIHAIKLKTFTPEEARTRGL